MKPLGKTWDDRPVSQGKKSNMTATSITKKKNPLNENLNNNTLNNINAIKENKVLS